MSDNPQKITLEQTVMTNMPQAVNRTKVIIENPEPIIRGLHNQVLTQAAEIIRLKSFAAIHKDIFAKTTKGDRVVGICPFSAN
jgi:hypothetical protein